MHPQFWLGLCVGGLMLFFGFALGWNWSSRKEIKEFNEKKYHRIARIIE